MTRADIAAYTMQGLMAQKSTAPAVEGTVFDYSSISTLAYELADDLIDLFGTAGDPDLYAVLALEAMIAKVLNDGSIFDYSNIIQAARDMSSAMNPV